LLHRAVLRCQQPQRQLRVLLEKTPQRQEFRVQAVEPLEYVDDVARA
jgi:hypothetical protein